MPGGARGFVTGGTWCVDRNKLVEYWPDEDGLVRILSVEQRGGGSACNFAVDIRRLDPTMPVATIGLVGDDEDGRFLLAEAAAAGIDRRRMQVTAEAPTQFTDAFGSRASGRRTHLYFEGTAALLTP
ncbi:MAG TPA: carbohydrate kinase family protein, partial [Acetobacteraceae bacterium]|nr:carbohydrate kinase family protein [Acetobacteraceae bacterium]